MSYIRRITVMLAGLAGGQPATPFHGWIDRMSATSILRAEVIPRHSPHADRRRRHVSS